MFARNDPHIIILKFIEPHGLQQSCDIIYITFTEILFIVIRYNHSCNNHTVSYIITEHR